MYSQSRFLTPQLTESELVELIGEHFDNHHELAFFLLSQQPQNLNELTSTVEKFESLQSRKQSYLGTFPRNRFANTNEGEFKLDPANRNFVPQDRVRNPGGFSRENSSKTTSHPNLPQNNLHNNPNFQQRKPNFSSAQNFENRKVQVLETEDTQDSSPCEGEDYELETQIPEN